MISKGITLNIKIKFLKKKIFTYVYLKELYKKSEYHKLLLVIIDFFILVQSLTDFFTISPNC